MSTDYNALALYLVPGATPGLKAEIVRALRRTALEAKIEEAITCSRASESRLFTSWAVRHIDDIRTQLAALDAEAKR